MASFLKKVVYLAIAIFLADRSLELMAYLLGAVPGALQFPETFLMALFLNLCITGVFAFPGFVFPTSSLLGEEYYAIRWPRALERAYTLLGVPWFRSLLMRFFWGKRRNREKYYDGTRAGIDNLIFQSKQSEFGHLMSFICILAASVALFLRADPAVAAWAALINCIGNVYPVILQRHHRLRVSRLKARFPGQGSMESG